jgi:hypothetical protein
MRRMILLTGFLLLSAISLATINWAYFDQDKTHQTHQSISGQKQPKLPKVDGSKNPDQIASSTVVEILFKMLTEADEKDPLGKRKVSFLRSHDFNDAEIAAIVNAAYEYKRRVESLTDEADRLKNAHWPTPSQETMNHLTKLEGDKQGIISEVREALEIQLRNYDVTKLEKLLFEMKKKTKSFSTDLPGKKIGFNLLSNPFTAYAQAVGCDTALSIFVTTWADLNSMMVYGSVDYSQPFNNCGHTVSLEQTMFGPTCNEGVVGEASCPLQVGESFYDGLFRTSGQAWVFCPFVPPFGETYDGGLNDDSETVAPYLTVNPFDAFNPASIRVGPDVSGIRIRVTASKNANGSFNTEFSYQLVQGDAPVTIHIADSGQKSISGGDTINVPAVYDPQGITSNPTKIKAVAEVTSSISVRSGNQTSASILTITP